MKILQKTINFLLQKPPKNSNSQNIPIDFSTKTEKYGEPNSDWVFSPSFISSNSRILSFGVGENLSYENELISRFNCIIDVFDPTPKSIAWFRNHNSNKSIVMHEYGISNIDGHLEFMPPDNPAHVSHTVIQGVYKTAPMRFAVSKLSTILDKLQISYIDILKLDIEGSEYAVVDDLIHSGIRPGQILVEYHHRFPGIRFESTKNSVEQLRHYGYRVFHVSASSQEISFINADLL
jgi:FkbM family methyltransferase